MGIFLACFLHLRDAIQILGSFILIILLCGIYLDTFLGSFLVKLVFLNFRMRWRSSKAFLTSQRCSCCFWIVLNIWQPSQFSWLCFPPLLSPELPPCFVSIVPILLNSDCTPSASHFSGPCPGRELWSTGAPQCSCRPFTPCWRGRNLTMSATALTLVLIFSGDTCPLYGGLSVLGPISQSPVASLLFLLHRWATMQVL